MVIDWAKKKLLFVKFQLFGHKDICRTWNWEDNPTAVAWLATAPTVDDHPAPLTILTLTTNITTDYKFILEESIALLLAAWVKT